MEHTPVLTQELLDLLQLSSGDYVLDATVGLGGHSRLLLQATAPNGIVVGLDADQHALDVAINRLAPFGNRFAAIHANFAALNDAILGGGIVNSGNSSFQLPNRKFTHVIFDLGIGSHQLADETRGFSFTSTEALSMRYGKQTGLPPSQLQSLNYLTSRLNYYPDVSDILSALSANELAELLITFGEEHYRGRIAKALKARPIPLSSQAVAERVTQAVPNAYRRGRINPATRTFQALRLAVNRELEALAAALPQALELTQLSGFIAVISFHSLEDRIVKNQFRLWQRQELGVPVTKKPVTASRSEIHINPRARSAKLRVFHKAAAS